MADQRNPSIGTFVVTGLVIGIGYLIFQKVTLAKNLQVTFKRFDIKGNVLFPEMYVTLNIYNPTEFSAELQGVNGSIFVNQTLKIASVNSFQALQIEPYKGVELILKVDPVVSELITAIKNFLNQPLTPMSFIGTVRADNLSFSVNSTATVKDLI